MAGALTRKAAEEEQNSDNRTKRDMAEAKTLAGIEFVKGNHRNVPAEPSDEQRKPRETSTWTVNGTEITGPVQPRLAPKQKNAGVQPNLGNGEEPPNIIVCTDGSAVKAVTGTYLVAAAAAVVITDERRATFDDAGKRRKALEKHGAYYWIFR